MTINRLIEKHPALWGDDSIEDDLRQLIHDHHTVWVQEQEVEAMLAASSAPSPVTFEDVKAALEVAVGKPRSRPYRHDISVEDVRAARLTPPAEQPKESSDG